MSPLLTYCILGGMGVLALVLLFYASFVAMFIFGAPWVATRKEVARKMLEVAKVTEGEKILDLGCGHGAISILAAREYGARALGFDIHPGLIWWARWRALWHGISRKTVFKRANILKTHLPHADVVTIYLLEGLMYELRPVLIRDLDPETRIVSHGFRFGDIKPMKEESIEDAKIYLYYAKQLFKQ